VPSDFDAFAASNPIQFYNYISSTSDSVALTIYDASDAVCGSATTQNSTAGQWTQTSYTSSGCTPSAGDVLTFRVSLSVGVNSEHAKIGEIDIDYLAKF